MLVMSQRVFPPAYVSAMILGLLLPPTALAQQFSGFLSASYFSEADEQSESMQMFTSSGRLDVGGTGARASARVTAFSGLDVTVVHLECDAFATGFSHAASNAQLFLDPGLTGSRFQGTGLATGTGAGGFGLISFDQNGELNGAVIDVSSGALFNANFIIQLGVGASSGFGRASISGFFYDPATPPRGNSLDDIAPLQPAPPNLPGPYRRVFPNEATVSPAIPTAGSYLTAVFGSYGDESPFYIGPASEAAGDSLAIANLHASSSSLAPATIVTAYRYQVADNLFSHFILPFHLPGGDADLQIEVDGQIIPYSPGTLFDFTAYVPGGVSEFFLSGIDIDEGIRPDIVSPFISGLRFAQNGLADIQITPADVVLVPEPMCVQMALLWSAAIVQPFVCK